MKFLAVIVCAAALWGAGFFISDYTSGGYVRKIGHQRGTQNAVAKSNDEVKHLLGLLESADAKVDELVNAASKVVTEAQRSGDVELLLGGLSLYNRALEQDKNSIPALYGLADVSFQAGAFDKAYEYYSKLSELDPSDLRSKTNMALSLTQLGRAPDAVALLEKARRDTPNNFQILLTLALAYTEAGNAEDAKIVAKEAQAIAPDAMGKQLLAKFLGEDQPVSHVESASAVDGPYGQKALAESFFKEHQVLGPKVRNLVWDENTLTVSLDNFPIAQMPPFARTSLEKKLNDLAQKGSFKFILIDDATKEQLLVIG